MVIEKLYFHLGLRINLLFMGERKMCRKLTTGSYSYIYIMTK
jgi:hypothetical protein